MDKLAGLQEIVGTADRYTMSSGLRRRRFGQLIANELNLWEPNVQSFIEEMRGLNFVNSEDRQTFVEFFDRAFALMGQDSP
jgi:hypothetical protein